jgi:uncharacterized membrane protein YfcA
MELAASMLILLAAACLQGLAGFGYSLMSLPLLALFMPVRIIVPMLSITSVFINLVVFLKARKSADIRWILPLLLAGVVSIPGGVWILKHTDEALLKVIIGVLVGFSALLYLTGFRIRIRRERLALIPTGILSGLLNGITTFSGPPVILFLANQKVDKQVFRANLALYFFLLNIASVPVFVGGGLLTAETAVEALLRFPAIIIGVVLGIRLAGRIDEEPFRRVALIILALLGLLSALSGVGIL